MSTAAVSSSALSSTLQQYFQTRHTDLKQIGQALSSGDLAGAQTAFNNIVTLGQNGPFPGGEPFKINKREQAFTAIGTALQAGDLAGAQKAFSELGSTFKSGGQQVDPPGTSPTATATPNAGPEIVLNLSNGSGSASPEQITINISNPSNGGGEQVSLSVGNQGSNAQQVTFNLNPNSNEQIVLNLLNGSPSTSTGGSSSTTSSGGGLSVSA